MMVGRGLVNRAAALILSLLLLAFAGPARAEDGHSLWLRYAPLDDEARNRLGRVQPNVIGDIADPTNFALDGDTTSTANMGSGSSRGPARNSAFARGRKT